MQLHPLHQAIQKAHLRSYQQRGYDLIHDSWASGNRNVVAVYPTGAGKTVLLSQIVADNVGASCVIAHRSELVSQISIALARNGIYHRIIGPKKTIKNICRFHIKKLGQTFYDPQAPVAVASVDTLINRKDELKNWTPTVNLWVQDECHHVLRSNKWGEAADMFPNARGLGVTATPERADGKGLGRHASGVFDDMVVGPNMRELIDLGFLTDYRIICPPSNFHRPGKVGGTGDFTRNDMVNAVSESSLLGASDDGKSRVIGDVVQNYQKFAAGKLGVAFVPDTSTGERLVEQFIESGVTAALVTAKTPEADRTRILQEFEDRKYMVLVNVDLFGEGFDLPAIEVVMMARPTESYSLYAQQFGRALRLMIEEWLQRQWDNFTPDERRGHISASSKPRALIIDHVGNVYRHGLPDTYREWSLDDRDKRGGGKTASVQLRTCHNPGCMSDYDRILRECPFCGTAVPPPALRSGPEWVDGDLFELDAETLAKMRGAVAKVDQPVEEAVKAYHQELIHKRAPAISIPKHLRRFEGNLIAQKEAVGGLRDIMAWWAGHHRAAGRDDSEVFRRFYLKFGTDWLTAQTLAADAALTLAERVAFDMGKD